MAADLSTSSVPIRHFYHLAACTDWEAVAEEHAAALDAAAFPWPITTGLVGDAERRAQAREWFTSRLGVTNFAEARQGWEDTTLRALWRWARDNSTGIVLYAHAKGTFTPHPINNEWRRAMTVRLIGGWRLCLERLAGVDAVGCHWLTPDEYGRRGVTTPFFGGNFWWARCSYIVTLPEPQPSPARHDSEGWLGIGSPQVYDLRPGWPRY